MGGAFINLQVDNGEGEGNMTKKKEIIRQYEKKENVERNTNKNIKD